MSVQFIGFTGGMVGAVASLVAGLNSGLKADREVEKLWLSHHDGASPLDVMLARAQAVFAPQPAVELGGVNVGAFRNQRAESAPTPEAPSLRALKP